jgi:hypothetical protein
MADEQNQALAQQFTANANYVVDESEPITFVDNMSLVTTENEFFLGFFQTQIPLAPGEMPQQVNRRCVARLVITPSTMREIVRVMNANWEKYEAASGEKGEG